MCAEVDDCIMPSAKGRLRGGVCVYIYGLIVHKTEKAFDAIQMCLGAFRILNFSEETTDSLEKGVCVAHVIQRLILRGGCSQPKTLPVVSMCPSP